MMPWVHALMVLTSGARSWACDHSTSAASDSCSSKAGCHPRRWRAREWSRLWCWKGSARASPVCHVDAGAHNSQMVWPIRVGYPHGLPGSKLNGWPSASGALGLHSADRYPVRASPHEGIGSGEGGVEDQAGFVRARAWTTSTKMRAGCEVTGGDDVPGTPATTKCLRPGAVHVPVVAGELVGAPGLGHRIRPGGHQSVVLEPRLAALVMVHLVGGHAQAALDVVLRTASRKAAVPRVLVE